MPNHSILSFNHKPLTKIKEKNDGKNVDTLNGIYQDEEHNDYFVKRAEKEEFFAELFMGLAAHALLELWDKKGLIPPNFKNIFLCASTAEVQQENNKPFYILVQPLCKDLMDLHQVLPLTAETRPLIPFARQRVNAALRENMQRLFSNYTYDLSQTASGKENKTWVDEMHNQLAFAVMMKILFADFSVHSGNIGIGFTDVYKDNQVKAFDFGAALRYIFNPDKNVFTPPEKNHKRFYNLYKSYIDYYRFPKFFKKIKNHASQILKNNNSDLKNEMETILTAAAKEALEKFKTNLENGEWGKDKSRIKKEMAHKLGIQSSDIEKLPQLLTKTILVRLEKIHKHSPPSSIRNDKFFEKKYDPNKNINNEPANVSEIINMLSRKANKYKEYKRKTHATDFKNIIKKITALKDNPKLSKEAQYKKAIHLIENAFIECEINFKESWRIHTSENNFIEKVKDKKDFLYPWYLAKILKTLYERDKTLGLGNAGNKRLVLLIDKIFNEETLKNRPTSSA